MDRGVRPFARHGMFGFRANAAKAVSSFTGGPAGRQFLFEARAFVGIMVVGRGDELDLAWDLSDTFNGLMMLPNLVGVAGGFPAVAGSRNAARVFLWAGCRAADSQHPRPRRR